MYCFLATFAPGFESIIGALLLQVLPSAAELRVSSGLARFKWMGPFEKICSIAFFNNIFLIIREWDTNTITFPDMVSQCEKKSVLLSLSPAIQRMSDGTFRVRYSRENQFCSVDKKVMEKAELSITSQTGLVPDRLNPGMEFWYIIRREECSFFAACLTKKQSTEKYLRQGELRPEIVQLIVGLARVTAADKVLLDPFAGYGSIPEQLARIQSEAKILASDNDEERVADLTARFANNDRFRVCRADAVSLDHIADSAIDLIVTDPPWGFWNNSSNSEKLSIIPLYESMLREFHRILIAVGRAFVLTGAKKEFEEAVSKSSVFASSAEKNGFRTDILVNGRKSAVYALFK